MDAKLMKCLILFIIFNVYLPAGYAQKELAPEYVNIDKSTTLDSAYLKCAYQLTYLRDSLKTNSPLTDQQTLLVGKTISKYYSQKKLDYNKFIKKEAETQGSYSGFPDGVWSYELFKNYPQGKVSICDIGSVLHGNFVYEDTCPVLVWTIENETQTILSHNCQKAKTSLRGRNYIAWFTSDIPIPNGPWQFGGLPGLILKVCDTKENFIFECTGIENLRNRNEPVLYYLVDYTKLSRTEYRKINERFHEDYIRYERFHETELLVVVNPTTGKETRMTSFKLAYNPIELE
jgi:GLPGLI family protein